MVGHTIEFIYWRCVIVDDATPRDHAQRLYAFSPVQQTRGVLLGSGRRAARDKASREYADRATSTFPRTLVLVEGVEPSLDRF